MPREHLRARCSHPVLCSGAPSTLPKPREPVGKSGPCGSRATERLSCGLNRGALWSRPSPAELSVTMLCREQVTHREVRGHLRNFPFPENTTFGDVDLPGFSIRTPSTARWDLPAWGAGSCWILCRRRPPRWFLEGSTLWLRRMGGGGSGWFVTCHLTDAGVRPTMVS